MSKRAIPNDCFQRELSQVRFPSERSKVTASKRHCPNEGSKANSLKRTVSNTNCRTEFQQRKIPEIPQETLQAISPKRTLPMRRIPRQSSRTNNPKLQFLSNRCQVKCPKRRIPSGISQAEYPKDPKRKLPCERCQANVPRRTLTYKKEHFGSRLMFLLIFCKNRDTILRARLMLCAKKGEFVHDCFF